MGPLVILIVLAGFGLGWLAGAGNARRKLGQSLPASLPVSSPTDMMLDVHDRQRAEIDALLAADRRIEAIKVYREATGAGLKESRDAIDRWAGCVRGEPPAALPSAVTADPVPVDLPFDDGVTAGPSEPWRAEIDTLVSSGRLIEAIKAYRKATSATLSDSKLAIDNWTVTGPGWPQLPPSSRPD